VAAYKYDAHFCQRALKGSKYVYTHGKNDTVDLLNPKDLSHVVTLEIDDRTMFFAMEVSEKYLFLPCAMGPVFCFDLKTHQRLGQGTMEENCWSGLELSDNVVVAGELSGYLEVFELPDLKKINTSRLTMHREIQ